MVSLHDLQRADATVERDKRREDPGRDCQRGHRSRRKPSDSAHTAVARRSVVWRLRGEDDTRATPLASLRRRLSPVSRASSWRSAADPPDRHRLSSHPPTIPGLSPSHWPPLRSSSLRSWGIRGLLTRPSAQEAPPSR
jgi:hypothetical protein